jgi:hypothetical protein
LRLACARTQSVGPFFRPSSRSSQTSCCPSRKPRRPPRFPAFHNRQPRCLSDTSHPLHLTLPLPLGLLDAVHMYFTITGTDCPCCPTITDRPFLSSPPRPCFLSEKEETSSLNRTRRKEKIETMPQEHNQTKLGGRHAGFRKHAGSQSPFQTHPAPTILPHHEASEARQPSP